MAKGEPSPLPVPEIRCMMGKERDFNEKPKDREPKCKLSTPHQGVILSPKCTPFTPLQAPSGGPRPGASASGSS